MSSPSPYSLPDDRPDSHRCNACGGTNAERYERLRYMPLKKQWLCKVCREDSFRAP